jgi:broad specificity phosphatase PhoE
VTEILLIRHGETEWNAEQRVQGHTNSALTDLGRRQAEAVARRLRDARIDALYASDLGRARETAEAIAAGRGLDVQTTPALREKNYGHWEGRTIEDVKAVHADEWRSYHILRDVAYRIPGAEIWAEVHDRVVRFLEEVAERHHGNEGAVAVVGHGGSVRVAVLHAIGAPLASLPRLKLDNCGLTRLSRDDDGHWRVVTMNDVSHLDGVV